MSPAKIKAIIIEDEAPALDLLQAQLWRYCPDVEVVATGKSAESGIKLIAEHHPDLVFLDIVMPRISGFELLDQFEKPGFETVFVTGHQEYALDAIRRSAVDFLLKPVNSESLIQAVEKARVAIDFRQGKSGIISRWDQVAVPGKKGLEFVMLDDIIRIEGKGDHSDLFLVEGKVMPQVPRSVEHWQKKVVTDNTAFFRIGDQHIIHMKHVDRFVDRPGFQVFYFKDGSELKL